MSLDLIRIILLGSIPLIAAALGGMYSEKSGIVNIGLEGIMTFAAFTCSLGVVFAEQTLSITGFIPLLIGVFTGVLGGLLFAYIHALFTIRFKMDQIIAGSIINIVSLALAIFLTKTITNGSASTAFKNSFSVTLFNIPLLVYFILLLIPISYYILEKTKWGLHLKACGENPKAAKAAGINVNKVRFQAVLVSGILGALGGIALVYIFSGNFSASTVAGKGFIALAVLIFGKWNPFGILFSGLLFGFLSSLGVSASVMFQGELQISKLILIAFIIISIVLIIFIKNNVIRIILSTLTYVFLLMILSTGGSIPNVYYDILPYIMTIVALVYYSKDSTAPAALGEEFS